MIKTVTYIGDSIDDSAEFLELEKARELQLACWNFEQLLRRLWKDEDKVSVDVIWDLWHEEMSDLRDVINS